MHDGILNELRQISSIENQQDIKAEMHEHDGWNEYLEQIAQHGKYDYVNGSYQPCTDKTGNWSC